MNNKSPSVALPVVNMESLVMTCHLSAFRLAG